MAIQVIMPQLGESVVEGTITRWLKAVGDPVEEFEPILELNTDKVDTEVPSPASGILMEILAPEGKTVHAGEILAMIGEADEASQPAQATAGSTPSQKTQVAPSTIPEDGAVAQPSVVKPSPETVINVPGPGRDRDLGFISPVVARIASEQGVDLYQVTGSGQGGRITKQDVLAYLENRKGAAGEQIPATRPSAPSQTPTPAPPVIPKTPTPPQAPPTAVPVSPSMPGEIQPLSAVRRAIADHMVYSKHTSPHVTTAMEVELSRVTLHRTANKETFARDGVNLTFTAYFIAAAVTALKAFPMVNASWSEEGILFHREINIGMATSLGEEGLIVPVIKNADGLSLLGLARTINDLANRARSHKLQPDEVRGGTFTLTNHGTTGSLFATPIINQPQCAILGVGVIQKRVVVIDDAIAIRPMAYLTLTFDHRILDGAVADHFLGKVVESLRNWS